MPEARGQKPDCGPVVISSFWLLASGLWHLASGFWHPASLPHSYTFKLHTYTSDFSDGVRNDEPSSLGGGFFYRHTYLLNPHSYTTPLFPALFRTDVYGKTFLMNKIKTLFFCLFLLLALKGKSTVILNNFYMDVQVLNPLVPGTNRVDLCPGGVLQLKNISTYGTNWPVPSSLTGTYSVWFQVGSNLYTPSIAASTWYYNQTWNITIPVLFGGFPIGTNSSPYNFYIQYHPGPGEVLGTNPQTQDLIYVRVLPVPSLTVSSNTSICPGSSTTLTAGGASSYSWTPAGSLGSPTSASTTATPTVSTTYTVTGTGSNGCTATQTVSVSMLPKPTVSFNPSIQLICNGSPVTFSASVSGSGTMTYQWYIATSMSSFTSWPGSGPSVTLTSANYTPYIVFNTVLNSNMVIMKLVVSNGSCSTETYAYAVLQNPITYSYVSGVTLCYSSINGSPNAVFGVSAPNAFGFAWEVSTDNGANWSSIVNGSLYTGCTTNSLTVHSPGTSMNGWLYRCMLTGQACPAVWTNAGLLTVYSCRFGAPDEGDENSAESSTATSVRLSPNPTTGLFTIEKDNDSETTFEIYDAYGRLVSRSAPTVDRKISFDLSMESPGIYFVRLISGERYDAYRIVKQ